MYFWYVVVLYPRDTIENHWNRRLAEAAITVYEGTKMRDKYIELLDGYWDQTEKLTLDELNFMEKNRQFIFYCYIFNGSFSVNHTLCVKLIISVIISI